MGNRTEAQQPKIINLENVILDAYDYLNKTHTIISLMREKILADKDEIDNHKALLNMKDEIIANQKEEIALLKGNKKK